MCRTTKLRRESVILFCTKLPHLFGRTFFFLSLFFRLAYPRSFFTRAEARDHLILPPSRSFDPAAKPFLRAALAVLLRRICRQWQALATELASTRAGTREEGNPRRGGHLHMHSVHCMLGKCGTRVRPQFSCDQVDRTCVNPLCFFRSNSSLRHFGMTIAIKHSCELAFPYTAGFAVVGRRV